MLISLPVSQLAQIRKVFLNPYDCTPVHHTFLLANQHTSGPDTTAEDPVELKRRINQLEEEVSSLRFDKQQVRQAAIAECNVEIAQLRQTIQVLRDEMDAMDFDKQQAVQAAIAGAQAEIHQLQETVHKLRQVLDDAHFEKDQAVQQTRTASRAEVEQLKATVQALRDQLDLKPN